MVLQPEETVNLVRNALRHRRTQLQRQLRLIGESMADSADFKTADINGRHHAIFNNGFSIDIGEAKGEELNASQRGDEVEAEESEPKAEEIEKAEEIHHEIKKTQHGRQPFDR